MTITKTQNGSSCTLHIEGRLDTSSAPQLDSEIKSVSADVTDLILDFEKLDYISSAGLRVLLAGHTDMNERGKMTLSNVSTVIMEIFEVTGFSDILNFS